MHTRELMQRISRHASVRVIHFCQDESPSNEQAVAQSHYSHHQDRGVDTIAQGPYGWRRWCLSRIAQYYDNLPCVRPLFNLLMRQYVRQAIEPHVRNADVVHFVYNGVTAVAEACLALCKAYHVPYVITPLLSFGLRPVSAHPGRRLLKVLRGAAHVVALTPFEKRYLIHLGLRAEKISVIPVGPLLSPTADIPGFRKRYGLRGAPTVLFLARHTPDKGYTLLLDAMRLVWQRQPTVHFVFMGPKNNTAETLIKHYRDPRVISLGSLNQQLKSDALAACDLLCLPTSHEGLGGVFVEAWQYKKPVIGGDIPLLREVFGHGMNGALCALHPEAVAQHIITLLAHPEYANALGQNGWAALQSHYCWPDITTRLLNLYQQTLPPTLTRKRKLPCLPSA